MAGSRSLGTLTLDIIAKIGGFVAGMNKAERHAAQRSKQISASMIAIGTAMGHYLVEGAEKAYESIKRALEQADQFGKAAQKIGLGVEAYSRLAFAANQVDVSNETLGKGIGKLAKFQAAAAQGTKDNIRVFEAFGIAIKDSSGHLRDTESVLKDFAEVFRLLPDGPEKTALALKVFSRAGTEMIPLLNLGAKGIKNFGDEAERTGNVISEDTARASEELALKAKELDATLHGLSLQIAADLTPDLVELVDAFHTNYIEGDNLKTTAHSIAEGLRFMASAASAAVEQVRALTSVAIALWNVLNGLAKLNLPTYLANRLSGNAGPAEDFRNAGVAMTQAVQATEAERAALGFGGGAGHSSAPHGHAHDARGRGAASDAALAKKIEEEAKNLYTAEEKVTKATHGKSDADRAAEKAARDHAKEMEELRKQVEETTQAHTDFETHAQDLADELAGPAAQALTEYTRKLIDLTLEGQKGEATTEELAAAQANLTAAYLKDKQAVEDRLNTGKKVLEDLQFQIDLTNMATDAERQRAQFMHDNVTATQADADAYVRMMKEFKESNEAIGAADEFRGHWEDAFASILDGSKSVKEAFSDLAKSILADIARMLAHKWVEQLFGGYGTQMGGGTSGGGWASLISSLFSSGGSSGGGFASLVGSGSAVSGPGYASGTDFHPGGMAWVGERGRELVNLPRGSQVIPNHKLKGAGFTQVINNNYSAPTETKTQQQMASRVAFETKRAMVRA